MSSPSDTALETPLATPERAQRADAKRNRERVIRAARKLMARDGLDTQMEDIARAAGVGVGTVYRHFRTKDELIAALADDRFERLRDLAVAALAQDNSWETFEGFIRGAGLIQTEDRALSEVLTSRPEVMAPAAEAVGMLDLTRQILKRAQSAAVVRRDAKAEDIPMIMCALAGTFGGPFTYPDRYIGIVLDGLRAPGGPQTKLG